MLKRMRSLSPALLALLVTSACFCVSGPPAQDNDVPLWGIWARGDTVLLFAHVRNCEEDSGAYKPAQTLVSTDGGRTWAMKGPRLIGRSFQYILNVGDEIWLAGDSYAEGPATNPFLLLVDPQRDDWPEFQIYDGNEEFRALAHDERDPNRFLHGSITWRWMNRRPRVSFCTRAWTGDGHGQPSKRSNECPNRCPA